MTPPGGLQSPDVTRRRPPLSRLSLPLVLTLLFLGPGLLGGLLLATPLAQARPVGGLDALFTGLSAVCLNGLSVVPLRDFSGFGQGLILALVQFGGLASLFVGALLALTLGGRGGLGERLRLAAQLARQDAGPRSILRFVLALSLGAELLGTLLLWPRFAAHDGPGQGLFSAFFHAVAASNNSAFSLYPQGLNAYVADPLVSLLLPALALLGGLGVPVQLALLARWRERREKRPAPLSTSVRLLLWGSLALALLGPLGVALSEWTNPATLGGLPPGARLLASVFQGLSARGLGMHTLDPAALRPITWLLLLALMFVGSAPASSGGGVKLSTLLIALGGMVQVLRGRAELTLLRRRIETWAVLRAAAVLLLALILLCVGVGLLLLLNPRLPAGGLLVEGVAALSSVGLSLGLTPALGVGGKLVVMLLMLAGRVLPLLLLASLGRRPTHDPLRYPPERDLLIG